MTARWLYLTVMLEDRDDGGLNVSCEDLPGLILSGSDKQKIFDAIAPAIQALLEFKGFKKVRVHHSSPLAEILKRESPRGMDVHVQAVGAPVKTELFSVVMEPAAA
jgi:hypothetical protein